MFASIKPGGHFERKTRSARGKKPSKSPLLREKKKKLQRARGNRARRTPRDLYATTQTPPKHRPRTFRSHSNRSRRDFARPNNQKYASTINVHTRTACTNLPNFVHGVQTSLSSFPLPPPRPRPPPRPLPPPLSPPRPRRSPLSPPRPKPRENPPLSDSSAIVYVFCFVCLFACKKVKTNAREKKLRKEAKIHATTQETRESFNNTTRLFQKVTHAIHINTHEY
jgi:hypothetical protein